MPLPLAIPLALAGAGLLSKGVNYFSARSDEKEARRQLAALQDEPLAKYTESPELRGYYTDARSSVLNPQGITPAERAAYTQNVANTINTQYRNATNTAGGNLSRFIRGALNPAAINASNQLVAQDQGIKRANQQAAYGRLGSAVSAIQGIQNQNTQAQIQRRLMIEQALGQSALQNKAYQSNTLDSMGSDLLGGGLLLAAAPYLGEYSGSYAGTGSIAKGVGKTASK